MKSRKPPKAASKTADTPRKKPSHPHAIDSELVNPNEIWYATVHHFEGVTPASREVYLDLVNHAQVVTRVSMSYPPWVTHGGQCFAVVQHGSEMVLCKLPESSMSYKRFRALVVSGCFRFQLGRLVIT